MSENLLELRNLRKYFTIKKGILEKATGIVKSVDDVSLVAHNGAKVAIVGESGSGKTTLGKTIIRLYKPTSGEIWLGGHEISQLEGSQLMKARMDMQMVFQDPASSLNPRRNVKSIISGPLEVHKIGDRATRSRRVKELLNLVELSEDYATRPPGALSGGEKQRVAIARSLALNPKLIILDEPTSSLDVSVQAKILALLNKLQKKSNLTYLLITHDLSVVRNFVDTVFVMYRGKIVEWSTTQEIFNDPIHRYTKRLLSALPVIYDEELAMLPNYAELNEADDEIVNRKMVQVKKDHWVALDDNQVSPMIP